MLTGQQPLHESGPDDDIVLGVLDVIERDPAVTQRSVARELGIALGLANAYLNRCIRKGLIKVSQAPARRYAYYLTPQGFAEKSRLTAGYLAHSFSFFRQARAQCDEILATASSQGQRRLVLLGVSELADITKLVATEHLAEIVAVLPASSDPATLTSALAPFGSVDAFVVTALDDPRAVFDAAVAAFGSERVYVPQLLKVHRPAGARQ